jgi:hypothetical protein
MLELVTATRYDRRMTNGKTKPCLMACERKDGSEVECVVKLAGGCDRGLGGLVMEAMSAMFAADLGLPVPEPFLVQIAPGFVDIIPDDLIRDICSRSPNIAFGSQLLPPSNSVWLHSRAIPQGLQQQALEIFAFDALVMNADRRPENPNCQSDGISFAIYDHELCFVPVLFAPKPWESNGLAHLKTSPHLFQSSLRSTALGLSRFAGAIDAITPARIDEYVAALPVEWRPKNASSDPAIEAAKHLKDLRNNVEAAITQVIEVLL